MSMYVGTIPFLHSPPKAYHASTMGGLFEFAMQLES